METELSSILHALPGLVWTARPDGQVDFLNQRWCEYTGFKPGPGHIGSWELVTHPEDWPPLLERWRSSLMSGEPLATEARLRRFDGEYRWFLVRVRPLADASGQIIKWCGINTEIDHPSDLGLPSLAYDDGLRSLADSIPANIALMNPAGEVETVNRHVLEYFGTTLDELKQWSSSETVHPDDLPAVLCAWKKSVETGEPYDIEHRSRRADGVYRWFHVSGLPVKNRDGRIVRWCVVQTDIDDQKKVEALLADEREQSHRSLTQALGELTNSERRLRSIVDAIPGFVWSASPDGSVDFLNQQWCDFTGIGIRDADGWGWATTVHPDDANQLAAYWGSLLQSGQPGEFEARLRRFDGTFRWFLIRAVPLRDNAGRILKWYGLNTEIEDRKRAEDEFRRSEARNAAILHSALDAIVTIDHHGCMTEFNPAAQRTFGYRREEILGANFAGLFDPSSFANWCRQGLAEDLAIGEPRLLGNRIEATAVRAGGQSFPVELAITRILSDGPPAFTAYLRDITDRKRAEEELRRSEAFLLQAQHLSRVGSFFWCPVTGEITWSEELYRIFEIDPGVSLTIELIGTRVHPEDLSLLHDMVQRASRAEEAFEYEHRLLMPDQSVKHVHLLVRRTQDQDGGLEYIGAVQDVTQRWRSEDALGKARSDLAHVARVVSLGVLTASIAHEVNQPLAGIITNASTCLRMLASTPPNIDGARETALRTIRDGNRASDVIARLRALFSKKETAAESVDLNEAAREVIALSLSRLRADKIILQTEFAADLPSIIGDRVQLQQVLLNLVLNASDAMSKVENRPRQLIIKTEMESGGFVRVSVQDTGVGFEPQEKEKLFDAFYTTKSDGMGIGLSVSRSIIESHQGRLWAVPNAGPGAMFSFIIPCQSPASMNAGDQGRLPSSRVTTATRTGESS